MGVSVLHVAGSPLASSTGGGRTRIISIARQGRKHGHPVRILCFFPAHHAVSKRSLLRAGRRKLEEESGCTVHYAPRFPLTRISVIHWINNWYCGLVLRLVSARLGIAVVHAHTVKPALFACFARRLGARNGIVADFHGVEAEEYQYEQNIAEPDWHVRRMHRYEATILREADWIVFVSDVMRREYEGRHGAPLPHWSVIPCATDLGETVANGCRDALRQQHQLDGRLVFTYAGSSENYQLPDVMCRLFAQILARVPHAFFLIFSHHTDAFLRFLAAEGVDSSAYRVQGVDRSQIFELLQMGDIGFLMRSDSIVNRVASPTKFAEYCMCGVPVITTEHVGDFSEMVRQHDLGLIVDLQNLTVDSRMTAFLEDVRTNRQAYSRRCRTWAVEHLSWNAFGDQVAGIYGSLAHDARS